MPAPIALFVYNRPWHTEQTISALLKNKLADASDLFVFSDGPKDNKAKEKVSEVRQYVKSIKGFRSTTVVERDKNLGLARSIINGVTEMLENHDTVIVLEDDLVTSPFFLSYMNQALTLYENTAEVVSIHGYVYPVERVLPDTFFLRGADCWGWATWKRGWKIFEADGTKLLKELAEQNLNYRFDFDNSFAFTRMLENQVKGKNDSWAIRWNAAAFLQNKLTLYPAVSHVQNIGNDDSGAHSKSWSKESYESVLQDKEIKLIPIAIEESEIARKAFIDYFRKTKKPLIKKGIGFLKSLLK